jgi:hypothetical protein
LVASTSNQWCICDDFGTSANQFCCDQCFVGFFFGGSTKDFFLSTYANIFLWHHILNQHIHIETMYPFSITHFNTMIFIPLCENVNFVHIDMTWYEFSYFRPNTCIAMVYEFQKSQIPISNGYVKKPILVQHWWIPIYQKGAKYCFFGSILWGFSNGK